MLAEEVKLSFPLVPTDVCNFPNDPEKDIDVAIPVTLTDASELIRSLGTVIMRRSASE